MTWFKKHDRFVHWTVCTTQIRGKRVSLGKIIIIQVWLGERKWNRYMFTFTSTEPWPFLFMWQATAPWHCSLKHQTALILHPTCYPTVPSIHILGICLIWHQLNSWAGSRSFNMNLNVLSSWNSSVSHGILLHLLAVLCRPHALLCITAADSELWCEVSVWPWFVRGNDGQLRPPLSLYSMTSCSVPV